MAQIVEIAQENGLNWERRKTDDRAGRQVLLDFSTVADLETWLKDQ